MEKIEKLIPDTSVIIDGVVSKMIKEGKIDVDEIIIHEAVLAELEHQANLGREIGFKGLEEIKELRKLSEEGIFILRFSGRRPTPSEIRLAERGEIDAMIRSLAHDLEGTLITSDRVQAEVAKAYGIPVIYIGKSLERQKLSFEEWFDEWTTSIHIREGLFLIKKKGKPGQWDIVYDKTINFDREDVKKIAKEIIDAAKIRKDGFIEIARDGSTIVQLGNYRIVIVRPPVSDGWEITIVKPVKKLKLEDYNLDPRLLKRLKEKASGILIAGGPGHGKTTFAQALAEFYALELKKIVKTVESPRDLNVHQIITQYSKNFADSQEIHDILLLSRPDFVIFDEMRDTEDFLLYSDLRLAGVGMVGVVHATEPIEAIQRFIGRIELGLIPHIVDTVIFIRKGKVEKVLSLDMVVKVPTGMTEEDLARPVVEIRDYLTGELEYELYTFGEETILVPVKRMGQSVKQRRILEALKKELQKFLRIENIKIEPIGLKTAIVWIPSRKRAKLIGKRGKTVEKFERKYGIKIEVRDIEELPEEEIDYEIEETDRYYIIKVPEEYFGQQISLFYGKRHIASLYVSKDGEVLIPKDSEMGKEIKKAIEKNKLKIKLF